jgi:ribosomal-protein-alanine N-acetyltransferase
MSRVNCANLPARRIVFLVMPNQPILTTLRLVLRPFTLADGPAVQRLAGDSAIAETTLLVPHPYEDGLAEKWIATHAEQFDSGKLANFAICLRNSGELAGSIGLVLHAADERAELGYWVGKPYWGNGYCTEAARAVLEYGFVVRGLNRVEAYHFGNNPASGRVMQKLRMRYEGCQRQYHTKWGRFEDRVSYALLRAEYSPLPRLPASAT